jgi:AcrR family transcriptional regulator
MGHRHSKEEILDAAIECAFDEGLSQISFGRVAKRAGCSDRMVVYYFPTKDDLIGEAVVMLGLRLQASLVPAMRSRVPDHRAMVRVAWPVLTTPDATRVFGLFFEGMGLAAAGREPYASLVPSLLEAWIVWAADIIDVPTARRRAEAEAAISLLDGLLLFRQMAGPDAAARAFKRLTAIAK